MNWRQQLKELFADWNGLYVVTSPDVDGILSALLVLRHYPNARLFGLYDTERLVRIDKSAEWIDAKEALWVDLDVLGNIRCIGQHLLQVDENDRFPTRHRLSFNPNICLRQTWKDSFLAGQKNKRDKYPFGTVQFLMDYFDEPVPDAEQQAIGRALIAHADSSWASVVKYGDNCQLWQRDLFESGIDQTEQGVDRKHTIEYLFGYTSSDKALTAHKTMVYELQERAGDAMLQDSSRTNCVTNEDRMSEGWLSVKGKQSVEYRAVCTQSKDCTTEQEKLSAWTVAFARVWRWAEQATAWHSSGSSLVTEADIVVRGQKRGQVSVKPALGRYHFGPTKLQTLEHFTVLANVFSFAIITRQTLRCTRHFDLLDVSDDAAAKKEENNSKDDINAMKGARKRLCCEPVPIGESANKKPKL